VKSGEAYLLPQKLSNYAMKNETERGQWSANREHRHNTKLVKVLYDHDVGLVEFALAEEERFTIRRN
jgi:hypothetical protein